MRKEKERIKWTLTDQNSFPWVNFSFNLINRLCLSFIFVVFYSFNYFAIQLTPILNGRNKDEGPGPGIPFRIEWAREMKFFVRPGSRK